MSAVSNLPDDPNMPESVRKAKEAMAVFDETPYVYEKDMNTPVGREYAKKWEDMRKTNSSLGKEGHEYIRKYHLSVGCIQRGTGPMRCCNCYNLHPWDGDTCVDEDGFREE